MADRELDKLARYMVHIANVEDFRNLRHKVYSVHATSGITFLIFRMTGLEGYLTKSIVPVATFGLRLLFRSRDIATLADAAREYELSRNNVLCYLRCATVVYC
jgi:hypothetical protein